MNRRSFVRWLGLAPVAAPAAVAAMKAPKPVKGPGRSLDLLPDGSSRFVVDANYFYFDGTTLHVPNLRIASA